MSQAQLGHPYIGRAAISSIEHGRSMPSLRSLAHIAAQLHVSIRELFPPERPY
jgi:transcriptional regulator with XRE-family HTH domain